MRLYSHIALAAGWLAFGPGALSPAAAQAGNDLHAICINEIVAEDPQLRDQRSSMSLDGETIRLVTVSRVTRIYRVMRISKAKGECASRIMDAFRIERAISVALWITKDAALVDYNREQCSRDARATAASAPNTSLSDYVLLTLRCVSDRNNAARIKEWLDPDRTRGSSRYQNLDFRLFELAFAKSQLCKDQKEFVAYYDCFARAISEADLSRPQAGNRIQDNPGNETAVRNAAAPESAASTEVTAQENDAPAPTSSPVSDNDASQTEQQPAAAPVSPAPTVPAAPPAASIAPPPAAPTLAPVAPPAAAPTLAPVAPPAAGPTVAPAAPLPAVPIPRPITSRPFSLLTDYLVVIAIFALLALILAWAWRSAVIHGLFRGKDNDHQGGSSAGASEAPPAQERAANVTASNAPPIVPANGLSDSPDSVRELNSKMSTMQLEIGRQREVATRERHKNDELQRYLTELETKISGLRNNLAASVARQDQLAEERDERIRQHAQLAGQLEQLGRRHSELAEKHEELAQQRDQLANERNELTAERNRLAAERDELLKRRDELADRLKFVDSQEERQKSGLPTFISPADLGNPLSEFWVASAIADPKAHSRLEGALRAYKIAADDPAESGVKIFELVNDIGVHLYALMDAIAFDESRKREVAATWQAALNADGNRRFSVSVLWPGTPIEPSQMSRKDQRCRSELIDHVHGWVVKDKDRRVARRAIVE